MSGRRSRELIWLPSVEERLQKRYEKLVKEHLQISQSVAAGLNALPGLATSFASTQAAWRFYHNEATTRPVLAEPLTRQACAAMEQTCQHYGLVMHDWSHLNYNQHTRKTDRVTGVQSRQMGYELQTALLVSDRAGEPLAPLWQNVVTSAGVYTTRTEQREVEQPHLDELTQRMKHLDQLPLGRPLVHIIDREGDSVGHFRQWQGHLFLVRVKGGQRVQWAQQKPLLHEVAGELERSAAFVYCRDVDFHGRAAQQFVAETTVVLTRAARPKRKGIKRQAVAGPPVAVRLVVSQVRDKTGRVLAMWLLLTNLDPKVGPGQLVLWYYWRWRIESFFKLIKGAGLHLEHWQQESGLAIAKRLLVVSMACVLIWQLARNPSPEAAELRRVLVRLSGRQMKQHKNFTMPAMLEGIWTLLAMLDLLEHCDLSKLKQLAEIFFNPK
jgi:hypothetical protein